MYSPKNWKFLLVCLVVGLVVFGVSYSMLGQGQGTEEPAALEPSDGEQLMHAIVGDDDDLLEALLEEGVNPNEMYPAETGMLPLQMAISGGSGTIYRKVKLLLDHGADPNALDKYSKSSMHTAARFSSQPVTEVLLDAGGNPTLVTSAKLTPYEEAIANGNKGAVAAIKEKGYTLADSNRMDELRIGGIVTQGLKGVFDPLVDLSDEQRKAKVRNTVNELVGDDLMDETSAAELYRKIVEQLQIAGLIEGKEL